MQQPDHYEIFIIGGGVNGCGLARDASGRGFKVGLAEMNDLASGTSSASTKLIHGGLRYLEQYAFRLVREALMEREVIWRIAPHLVQPLKFLLPYHKGLRPAWMLRTGLFLYDHIGGRKELPKTKVIDFRKQFGTPLKSIYKKGFEYSDARVDDARLVVANARSALQLGADIFVRTKVTEIRPDGKDWRLTLQEQKTGKTRIVSASYIANMAGPWINDILQHALEYRGHPPVRLVKGSHIVVPKLYDHDRAYIFQNGDGRIIFAIPYQQDFTLLGTTDQDYKGDPAKVHISEEETRYICSAASEYFVREITPAMVVWSYSGVRPLYDDGASKAQEATRDYVLKEMGDGAMPPMLNAYGGKITTYRKLSEDAMEFIEKRLGAKKPAWTGEVALPGGEFPHNDLDGLVEAIKAKLPELDARTHRRLALAYGAETFTIFDQGKKPVGKNFGHGLYEIEVNWLIDEEWAESADDIVWRRSKLGLYFTEAEKNVLEDYVQKRLAHK